MESVAFVDELVKEYLLFRGYVKTFSCFATEKQNDKTGTPEIEPIADSLLSTVRNLDLTGFQQLWNTLESRFFTHLNGSQFGPTIRMMETSLQRAFLVKAVKVARRDKLFEFFETYSDKLTRPSTNSSATGAGAQSANTSAAALAVTVSDAGWEQWFALPYIKEPKTHPHFESYFTKKWFGTLAISLKNFLSTAFEQIPLPKLLAFNIERIERKSALAELRALRAENDKLKSSLIAAQQHLDKLRESGYRIFPRSATATAAAVVAGGDPSDAATHAVTGFTGGVATGKYVFWFFFLFWFAPVLDMCSRCLVRDRSIDRWIGMRNPALRW